MDLGSILKRIGKAALSTIPGGGVVAEVIGFVNDVLPKGQQVNEGTTGNEALALIDQLPAEQRNEVLLKKFDVEIAEIESFTEVQKALAQVDIQGASTRPLIARLFAWNVVLISDVVICGVFWALVNDKVEMIEQVIDLWPFILGIISPFIVLLKSYFGLRSKEKAQKYEAVSGTAPVATLASNILKKVLK